MKREVGGTTASEMPARLGLNRSPNSRSRVRQAQEVVLREVRHLLARAHRAEHAADPDARVGRRRQPRFVAGLERQQQRRAVQRSRPRPATCRPAGCRRVTVSS